MKKTKMFLCVSFVLCGFLTAKERIGFNVTDSFNFVAPTVDGVSNVSNPDGGLIVFDANDGLFKGRTWNSGWQVLSPSQAGTVKIIAEAYTVLGSDDLLLASSAGGAYTISLPDASSNSGKIYYFKKTDSNPSLITIDAAGSDTIDGLGSLQMGTQYDELAISSNGTNGWNILYYGITVAAAFESNAGGALGNAVDTTQDFEDKVFDALNCVTTGSGWVFTAPVAGKYSVSSRVTSTNGGGWSAGEVLQLNVFKNGSLYRTLDVGTQYTTHSTYVTVHGSTVVNLAAGDTIAIKTYNSSGAALNRDTVASQSWVTVHRVSN